jgi:hypothetical protein
LWIQPAAHLPILSADVHGKEILVFAVGYSGAPADAERALAPLRALGKPLVDVIGLQPYAAWQTAFDPLLTPGAFNYWTNGRANSLRRPLRTPQAASM